MIGGIVISLLALMPFVGLYGVLTGETAGVYILFGSAMLASSALLMMYTMTPTAFTLFSAKLKRDTVLFVWLENGIIKTFTGKFESGFIWLRKRLGYLVSGPEDRGFIDGVPVFLAYWNVGKTIQPKAMADITLLEKYGISLDYLNERLEENNILPIIDVSNEGEPREVYPEEVKA